MINILIDDHHWIVAIDGIGGAVVKLPHAFSRQTLHHG